MFFQGCLLCIAEDILCVVPKAGPKNRRACNFCHGKKVSCSLVKKDEEEDDERKTRRANWDGENAEGKNRRTKRPRRSVPAKPIAPIRRPRGAVQRAELEELGTLVQEQAVMIAEQQSLLESIVPRIDLSFWGVDTLLQELVKSMKSMTAAGDQDRRDAMQLFGAALLSKAPAQTAEEIIEGLLRQRKRRRVEEKSPEREKTPD